MDSRLLDILSAILSFSVFLIILLIFAVLPVELDPGIGYLAAIVIFIITISGAGFYINRTIS